MSSPWKTIGFVAQSAAVGLALAFVVVLLKPDLVNSRVRSGVSSYAPAVRASAPAVVNIYTERTLSPYGQRSGIRLRGRALGSGVVIDQRGYVVTNWHVIRDAEQIRVQLADGRVAIPELVGTDPETELALLRIDLPDLPVIKLGRSDRLEVGEPVLAIGNSLGLGQTVTMGIVSATGRNQLDLTIFENFIQTDAAINIGNSGGALVNTRGELVGINTAVLSSSPDDRIAPEGIGFAIPVNLVRGVMDQLIANGRVIRGYLGIECWDLPASATRAFGIDGPAVQLVYVGGPAAVAGLQVGDIITHINGERMLSQQQAMNLVASSQPGARVRIAGVRPGGGAFETEAVLEERAAQQLIR
ncbi:MAG TPA: trypsin-like peptidase domain-containing protein [Gammaproteobacteria bacterium]